jgi:hypothetical protein
MMPSQKSNIQVFTPKTQKPKNFTGKKHPKMPKT